MPTTMPLGKRSGQSLAESGVSGLVPSHLFHITDKSCGLCFLVDTGAAVSVFPPSRAECKRPNTSLILQAVNCSPLLPMVLTPHLDLGTFLWLFIIADVEQPILGADFLAYFNLLVDMTHSRLVDTQTPSHSRKVKVVFSIF